MHSPRLILASGSPYRRALLSRLGYPFEVIVPQVDEAPYLDETPAATATRLAETKARTVAMRAADALIIGADQVAFCEGQQLGKPGGHAKALAQLRALQGKSVEFHSGLCVLNTQCHPTQTVDVVTQVTFRTLPDRQLDAYLRIEQPYDVAGSVKAEGVGIALLESVVSDDPTALIGLPLIALTRMLRVAQLNLF